MLTNSFFYDIIVKRSTAIVFGGNGGIAQLARATGSYPVGHGFKSNSRYHSYPPNSADNCYNGPLVKRLRHRPFTAVTGVRFSHGSPKTKKEHIVLLFCFIQAAGLACNHAPACMSSPQAHGIAEGAFSAA